MREQCNIYHISVSGDYLNILKSFKYITLNIALKIFLSKGNNNNNKKQVGLHQTKKLPHSKGNHQQNEKAIYEIRENICKSYIW